MGRAPNPGASTRARVVARVAAAWATLFAVVSVYWATGGDVGAVARGGTLESRTEQAGYAALVAVMSLGKFLGGAAVLALAEPVGRRLLSARWLRLGRLAVLAAGTLMMVYAVANLLVRAVMAVGLIDTPARLRTSAARWHLVLWDPWWLAGGALFVATAVLVRTPVGRRLPWGVRAVTAHGFPFGR